MTDFDPTTNRIPFVLLTAEEQAILKAWPHGWQIFDADSWEYRTTPAWLPDYVYRGKPAPVVNTFYYNLYLNDIGGKYSSTLSALNTARPDSIGMICVEFVDGKPIHARLVKEDET